MTRCASRHYLDKWGTGLVIGGYSTRQIRIPSSP